MLHVCFSLIFLVSLTSCRQRQVQDQSTARQRAMQVSQVSQIGGPCEGCEGAVEYGDRQLSWVDTLEDFHREGPRIEISGTVYKNDGRTPAKDVIVYVYHTDHRGVYPTRGDEKGWGRRHGYLRTWLKTNDKGQYKFFTLRPGSYPNSRNPAHIHTTIKEPDKPPYWIDDFLFDDDPYLTQQERGHVDGRGGKTGILKNGVLSGGVTRYTRDITLGLNVPGYN